MYIYSVFFFLNRQLEYEEPCHVKSGAVSSASVQCACKCMMPAKHISTGMVCIMCLNAFLIKGRSTMSELYLDEMQTSYISV